MQFRCPVPALTLRFVALVAFSLLIAIGSPSLAVAETQPPTQNPSKVVLTISPNPAVVGETITFTGKVVALSGTGAVATGTMTFFDGSTQLGMGTLDGTATATITSSSLAVGNHTITAMYSGDANYLPETSDPVILIVQQMGGGQPTSTLLKINPNPAQVGTTVTLTAHVAGGTGIGSMITGTVTFYQDGVQIGTATISDGTFNTATFSTTFNTVGTYSMTAVYGGDANFAPSVSPAVSLTIVPEGQLTPTTTTLSSSATNANFGDTVTFTASVQGGQGNPPTGTVTFLDGSSTLGTGTLSNGVATFSTASLTIGTHTITAQYGGDSNFLGSTSSPLTETISSGGSQTFIISINPAVVNVNQGSSGTAIVTVSPGGGFNQQVTFVCSNLPLYAACTFDPPAVTPDGSNKPVTSTVTITTGTTKALLSWPVLHPHSGSPTNLLAVLSVGLLGLVQLKQRRVKANRRGAKFLATWSLFLLCLAGCLWLAACGGSGNNANTATPKGQTIVTVAGSTSTGAQTTTFTLNVQ